MMCYCAQQKTATNGDAQASIAVNEEGRLKQQQKTEQVKTFANK